MLEDTRAICISVSMKTGNRRRSKSGEGKKKSRTEDGYLECPFGMSSCSIRFYITDKHSHITDKHIHMSF